MNIPKDYTELHFDKLKMYVYHGLDDPSLIELCLTPPDQSSAFEKVQSSSYAEVYQFVYQSQTYYHKTFLPRNLFESIKSRLRGSRALRALRGHHLLDEQGFKTPRILITVENCQRNFIVTQGLDECFKIQDVVEKIKNHQITPRYKKLLMTRLGQTIGDLHRQGLSHGDLRCGNIMFHSKGENDFDVYFLDNERTVQSNNASFAWKLVNLVQLNLLKWKEISQTDRLRFFRAYLQQNPDLVEQKKSLVKQIQLRTQQRKFRKTNKRD